MSKGDFQPALREGEQLLLQRRGLGRDEQAELWARIEVARQGHRERVRRKVLSVAAVLTAATLAAVVLLPPESGTPPRATEQLPAPWAYLVEVAGGRVFATADARIELDPSGWVRLLQGSSAVQDDRRRLAFVITAPARIRRVGTDLRVGEGRFHFGVLPRQGPEAVRVLVSHGAIEVVGTRFVIDQAPAGGGGRVDLEEGRIRFRATDGRERLLEPGQSVSWPLEPPGEPSPSVEPRAQEDEAQAPRPRANPERRPRRRRHRAPVRAPQTEAEAARPVVLRPAPRPRPPFDLAALLERLDELRAFGRDPDATALLRAALPRAPEPARERLSFELGHLLARVLRRGSAACAHWRRHRDRYGAGRYALEIAAVEGELKCQTTGPDAGPLRENEP